MHECMIKSAWLVRAEWRGGGANWDLSSVECVFINVCVSETRLLQINAQCYQRLSIPGWPKRSFSLTANTEECRRFHL